MTKTVYFRTKGRFTNNLFQYFAAEIVKKIFNYDEVVLDTKIGIYDETSPLKESCFVIDDKKYVELIRSDWNLTEIPYENRNLYLDGFFQRSEVFKKMDSYLRSLFTKENTHFFNSTYRICDIVPSDNLEKTIEEKSLTLHIRLDDFLGDLQVFDISQMKELVRKVMKEHSLDTLYIVCDKLRQDWEFEYMAHFMDLDPIMISGSLLEDFNFMMNSSYLFTSASTLSWMAGFLGQHQKVFIPYNTFHGGENGSGQNLREFGNNCIVFDDMKYYKKPKKIGFLSNKLTLGGTEVAMYDYAHFNETILGNKSVILTRPIDYLKTIHWEKDYHPLAYEKFSKRFPVHYYKEQQDIDRIVESEGLDWLYIIKDGHRGNGFTTKCKTFIHCVFTTVEPHGTIYSPISDYLNQRCKTNFHVFPHMINLPNHNRNLRQKLNIPEDAIVFGGYGNTDNFNIPFVQKSVYDVAKLYPNIYFLFAKFNKFCDSLPNIIHLPPIVNLEEKVEFINTCDAMIWARKDGEIMSVAQGEFCIKNKPIICTEINIGDLGHKLILKDKAIWYTDYESLVKIFTTFDKKEMSKKDWNAYSEYTPEKVMEIFNYLIK